MKKSEIYRLAQGAVVSNTFLDIHGKLEILRELIAQEDMNLFLEKEEEEKANETV